MTSNRRTAALLVLVSGLAAPPACTKEPAAVCEIVWELRDGAGGAPIEAGRLRLQPGEVKTRTPEDERAELEKAHARCRDAEERLGPVEADASPRELAGAIVAAFGAEGDDAEQATATLTERLQGLDPAQRRESLRRACDVLEEQLGRAERQGPRRQQSLPVTGRLVLGVSNAPFDPASRPCRSFGMWLLEDGDPESFSWEWFECAGSGLTVDKLQEGGRLAVEWEDVPGLGRLLRRIEFLTDVEFRERPVGAERPRRRLLVREGSWIEWPLPEAGPTSG